MVVDQASIQFSSGQLRPATQCIPSSLILSGSLQPNFAQGISQSVANRRMSQFYQTFSLLPFRIAMPKSRTFSKGSTLSSLSCMVIAWLWQLVAHNPQPRHLLLSTPAVSCTVMAPTGQRPTQSSQPTHSSLSITASNSAFMNFCLSSPNFVIPFKEAQQQGQQLQIFERCLTFAPA